MSEALSTKELNEVPRISDHDSLKWWIKSPLTNHINNALSDLTHIRSIADRAMPQLHTQLDVLKAMLGLVQERIVVLRHMVQCDTGGKAGKSCGIS